MFNLGISIVPGTTACRLVPHKASPPHTPYPRFSTMETKTKNALVSAHHLLICVALTNEQWSSGHDESVKVDEWALIDNISARYSEEFTDVSHVFSSKAGSLDSNV